MNTKKLYSDNLASHRGRKSTSINVRLSPVFNKELDIEKLGRVIIALAMHNAKIKINNKQTENRENM